MLLLDERIKADGSHARTWAASVGDRLRISDDDGLAGELSLVAVDRVMCRYGRPLEHGVALEGDSLVCGEGGAYRLRRLRYHASVDAEGRDYLVWERPDGEPLETFTILTTDPNELMAPIHNRMPVILEPKNYDRWLDPGDPSRLPIDLLRPYPANQMRAWPVDARVGNVRNNDPGLLEAVNHGQESLFS